ncbi:NAD(P)H-dependent glycerol-3-phosphate dehydrogenase [Helicobacter suis]|uniref:Glycerol-3-phosphate dehydrogenase [NAD(P)+] n=2 Tax=Helicobacter suis TaxID=104628 RepID=E7G4Y9_9HELI|nr:NAD(P)H-dependent glycerol-3-phosphate dehydrogenase [Helicobacter suis]EFX41549.1 NAD(P)H-dependent glycerol-3-phosphate dehydrogenase [Helicobacter suis HS5]EFX43537.1 NAD(P)H-dependent glycerol-3-phosphate dehydrogenase [Helicobacter suis HS1]BCD45239.1 NAD(P)H-dependent glycerol-3-phosphate dehydrogenase GpsA [Helicobacter suis]BCD47030.1 NAD(P)H-dependent glycerol-3-phosphate dehydrogenase GpsA [Helicobacter suis]BCD48786.1 NAD(P)H-dependent glycerol-3-phosphate dehydrogenase GpsA [Hel
MDITVFGGGAWGRALAFALGHKNPTKIVSRRDLTTLLMPLNKGLVLKGHDPILQCPAQEGLLADLFVVAISVQHLRAWFEQANLPYTAKVLMASKGIEIGGYFVSDIATHFIPIDHLCFLAGPSFAREIMASLPCALAIHSNNATLAHTFAQQLPAFIRSYVQDDIRGGEIAGAYKNVIAIAAGVCDGLELGQGAKASLLSRGLVEMSRFGVHFGGKLETFLGLSGAGDLFLTANSLLSRNYRVGLGLAQYKSLASIVEELQEVAEGIKTTKAIVEIATHENIHAPIAKELDLLLEGKNPLESMTALIKR